MELLNLLAIARHRWVSILLITLLATSGAVAWTLARTPTYGASAQVYVSVKAEGTAAQVAAAGTFAIRRVKPYIELVTTPQVLRPVIERLSLPTTPEELAGRITTTSSFDTPMFEIKVTDPDQRTASDIANALTESLAEAVAALDRPYLGTSPVEVRTLRPATVATAPLSPSTPRSAVLGLILGLALGLGLAVTRDLLDGRVRTGHDIRAVTQVPVVAAIPHDGGALTADALANPRGSHARALQRLSTRVRFQDAAESLGSIVVTSARPGEGRTTVAIALALHLARDDAGSRVALVDADLHRPSIATRVGIDGSVGLTSVLTGETPLPQALQPWGADNLRVLPCGPAPSSPSATIRSEAMAGLLAELVEEFDIVVVDGPSLLSHVDGAILAKRGGSTLVVAGAYQLRRDDLTEALAGLEVIGTRVLGIVLNEPARRVGRQQGGRGPDAGASVGR